METVLILKGSDGKTLHEFTIESFSLNKSRPSVGGTTTGKDNSNRSDDIEIMKAVDKASPKLQDSASKGTRYNEATIVVRTKGPNSTESLRVQLSDVFISGYQFHGGQGDPTPGESITLNAGKREMIFPAKSQPEMEPRWELPASPRSR